MWTRYSNNGLWCFNQSLSSSNRHSTSSINSNNSISLIRHYTSTKRLKDKSVLTPFSLYNIMFIWPLIIGILLCPAVLCQDGDDETATTSQPDTAELVLEDSNPCKANPCGNGVCLQDKDE